MPHIKALPVALMAIARVVAIPVPASTQPSEPCPSTSIKSGQSTILGWQLAGSLTSLDQTCSRLENNQLQKWADLGLDTINIRTGVCGSSAPASVSSSSSSSTGSISSEPFPNIVTANSEIMKTFLTSSFDSANTSTFSYLCDSLSSDKVNGFFLDDPAIINATCVLGGGQVKPKAFTPLLGDAVNKTAVSEFEEAQSKIYANLYAASASSPEELGDLCSAASSETAQASYANLQLNAACVSRTVCSIPEPITVEQGEQALKFWTTKSFLAFMLNVSGQSGYKQFLCDELSVDAMDGLGLYGQAAKEEACKAASEEGSGGLVDGLVDTVGGILGS